MLLRFQHGAHRAGCRGVANARRRLLRGTAIGLVTVIALLSNMSRASAPTSASALPGYSLLASRLIGETPLGYRMYVQPTGPDARAIATAASTTAAQLRGLGLPVTFAGFGRPALREGIITVAEGAQGCVGSDRTLAETSATIRTLRSGDAYMLRADVAVCPRLYRQPYSLAVRLGVIRHELGHAMGLAHTNYRVNGSYQLMNAYTHSGVTDYRSGDIAGLRRLAAGAARVRSGLTAERRR
jgi:hypothetical protein